MKNRILIFGRIFVFSAFVMLFASCGKDENDEPKNPGTGAGSGEKIEYYVKYESTVSIPSSQKIYILVSVMTEKGIQKLKVPRTWNGIFGPFNDLATLSISGSPEYGNYNPNMTSSQGRISICRGNQPFILKADKSFNGTSFNVKYTVTKEDLK